MSHPAKTPSSSLWFTRYRPPNFLTQNRQVSLLPHSHVNQRYPITRDTSLLTPSSITDPNLLIPLFTSLLIFHPPNTRLLIPSPTTYSIPDSSALSTTVLDSFLFLQPSYHPRNHHKYVPASSLPHPPRYITNHPTHLLIHHRNQTYSSSMRLLRTHVPQIQPPHSSTKILVSSSPHPPQKLDLFILNETP